MRLDELFDKLNSLDFIENYYVTDKNMDDLELRTYRVIKIYGEDYKMAEIYIDAAYMMRTTYQGFDNLNQIQKQALFQVLANFSTTPVDQRSSELYFAYYNDLNNVTHFIKKFPGGRLTDEVLPLITFKNMEKDQLVRYLFTTAEFENFPKDYQPRYTPESFVKVISQEEMMAQWDQTSRRDNSPSQPTSSTDESAADIVKLPTVNHDPHDPLNQ